MSPRSSAASISISTGSATPTSAFSAGRSHETVGAAVSALVGSRWPIMRRTSSVRAAVSVTCSRPKPTDTESRVEMIAPPFAVVWPA